MGHLTPIAHINIPIRPLKATIAVDVACILWSSHGHQSAERRERATVPWVKCPLYLSPFGHRNTPSPCR